MEEPSSIVDLKATVSEEFEDPKKMGLAEAIARGVSICSWARKNDVPKTTAYRWAQEPQVRIEAAGDSPSDARSRGRRDDHAWRVCAQRDHSPCQ